MSEVQNVSTTLGLTRAANKISTKLSKKELSVRKSSRPEMCEKEEPSDVLPSVDTHAHYGVYYTIMHYIMLHYRLYYRLTQLFTFFESDCTYRYEVTPEGNTKY